MTLMKSTRQLTTMAIMAALSIILVYFVRFPLFPAAPYLEYDPADIPILICTFIYGPLSGLILTVVASTIQGLTVSAGSGVLGVVMHIFATGSFVLVVGNIYKHKKDRKSSVLALCAGTVTMVAMMCILNVVLTPIFWGTPRDIVIQMLIPIIIPFNFIKAGINSIVTFVTYKKIAQFSSITK